MYILFPNAMIITVADINTLVVSNMVISFYFISYIIILCNNNYIQSWILMSNRSFVFHI